MSKQLAIPLPSGKALIILGNLVVHIDEYLSSSGHPVDKIIIKALLKEPELISWIGKMDELALLPVKRG